MPPKKAVNKEDVILFNETIRGILKADDNFLSYFGFEKSKHYTVNECKDILIDKAVKSKAIVIRKVNLAEECYNETLYSFDFEFTFLSNSKHFTIKSYYSEKDIYDIIYHIFESTDDSFVIGVRKPMLTVKEITI